MDISGPIESNTLFGVVSSADKGGIMSVVQRTLAKHMKQLPFVSFGPSGGLFFDVEDCGVHDAAEGGEDSVDMGMGIMGYCTKSDESSLGGLVV